MNSKRNFRTTIIAIRVLQSLNSIRIVYYESIPVMLLLDAGTAQHFCDWGGGGGGGKIPLAK